MMRRLGCLCVLMVCCSWTNGAALPLTYDAPFLSYQLRGRPERIIAADLDGDHVQDLAVLSPGENVVDILLGRGDGRFLHEAPLSVKPKGVLASSRDLAVGDWDGDGSPDLLISEREPARIQVYTGNGRGGFARGPVVAAGADPRYLAIADVNVDGAADIIVGGCEDGSVLLLAGDGRGGVQDSTYVRLDGCVARVGMIVTEAGPRICAAYTNVNTHVGYITLLPPADPNAQTTYELPGGPTHFGVADMNGDGLVDLIVTCPASVVVSILLGQGDGSFKPRQDYRTPGAFRGIGLLDATGDGVIDLVTGDYSDDALVVISGFAGSATPQVRRFLSGVAPFDLCVGDFNGDGVPDVAQANTNSRSVSIHFGRPDGGFGVLVSEPLTATQVTEAKIDGDSSPDVLVAAGSYAASILTGGGRLNGPIPSLITTGGIGYFIPVDMDGDGTLDFVGARFESLFVCHGFGDGRFGVLGRYPITGSPTIAVGDIDADGDSDVVDVNPGGLFAFINNGAGMLSDPVRSAFGVSTTQIALTNLNGDAFPDLVIAGYPPSTLLTYYGNGAGGFAFHSATPVSGFTYVFALLDFDNDGIMDLAAPNDHMVIIMHGTGNSFVPVDSVEVGMAPLDVKAKRVGSSDDWYVATANRDANSVSVLVVDVTGHVRDEQDIGTERLPLSVAMVDVTGDGLDDIVTAHAAEQKIVMLRNNGPGSTPVLISAAGVIVDGGSATVRWYVPQCRNCLLGVRERVNDGAWSRVGEFGVGGVGMLEVYRFGLIPGSKHTLGVWDAEEMLPGSLQEFTVPGSWRVAFENPGMIGRGFISLRIAGTVKQEVGVTLRDVASRVIISDRVRVGGDGLGKMSIPASLGPGIYFMTVSNGRESVVRRMCLLK